MDNQLTILLNEITIANEPDLEGEKKLCKAVLDLLISDISTLYNVLYRIDLDENKVKEVFLDNPEVEIAAKRLTKQIIERQLMKLELRKRYSSNQNNLD